MAQQLQEWFEAQDLVTDAVRDIARVASNLRSVGLAKPADDLIDCCRDIAEGADRMEAYRAAGVNAALNETHAQIGEILSALLDRASEGMEER